MSAYAAHSDENQQFTITGVVGTLGTSDTGGTANALPVGVHDATGAMYVRISGTDVDIGGGAGTNVNIITGTVNRVHDLGTLGSIANIGIVHNAGTIAALPQVSVGTLPTLNITTGTINRLHDAGTVGSVANIGIVHNAGTIAALPQVSVGTIPQVSVGTLSDLPGGTVDLGTVVGADAAGGTSNTRPIQIGGTTSTGTVYGILVDTSGNPQVDVVNTPSVTLPNPVGSVTVTVGTVSKLPSDGTITQVTTVSNLNNGSVNILTGTVNVGTVTISSISADLPGGTLDAGTVVVSAINADLPGGTLDLGTIVGRDANAAAQTGNPIAFGGTDSGGTIRTVSVNSSGALSVTGASSGTVVEIEKGSISTGTLALVTTVSNLTNGSVRMTVGTISVLPDIPGGTLDLGTIVGADAAGGTSNTRPVQIGGTTSTGTVYGMLVDTAGNPQVDIVNTPTVNVNSGTINVGTANVSLVSSNGTITRVGHVGTIESMPAVGGGTQHAEDTAHVSGDGGYLMLGVGNTAGSAFAIAGDYIPFALDTTGKQYIATVTTVDTVTTVSNLTNGSINILTGTVNSATLVGGTLQAGTVNASLVSSNGTITRLGNIGTLELGTVSGFTRVITGTINGTAVQNGTVEINTVGLNTVNIAVDEGLTAGAYSISGVTADGALAIPYYDVVAGTFVDRNSSINPENSVYVVPVLGCGTIRLVRTSAGNGSALVTMAAGYNDSNLGFNYITDIKRGSIANIGVVHNAGTIQNLNDGTVHIDSLPVRIGTSYGTLGTTGAAVWGTIIAAAGAGTYQYIEGLSIVVHSGTVDCAITNIGVGGTTGAGVLARGQFVPGGGIVRDFTHAQRSGTNGTIAFWMGGAGTAFFQVNYYQAT